MLTRRKLLAGLGAGALLKGCSKVGVPEGGGWQPLHGTRYKTPRWFLEYWWTGPGGGIATPEEAGILIDSIYDEWQEFYMDKWGRAEGLIGYEIILDTYKVAIQLFPGSAIPGTGYSLHYTTVGIWWYDKNQIDTAMATPYHYDAALGRYTQGLEQLMHEWTHCTRGWWHS